MRLLGALNLAGQPLADLLIANSFMTGVAITGAVIAMSAMLADAADEHDLQTGNRSEGIFFAGWSFSSKAAGAFGALVAGIALDASGIRPGAVVGGGRTKASALAILGFASGPGAAIFSICGILVLIGYRLDRRRHAEILETLRHDRGVFTNKPESIVQE